MKKLVKRGLVFTLISLTLLSSLAVATLPGQNQVLIRIIGNGGGLAEMQFRSALSNLQLIAQVCHNSQGVCRLSDTNRKLLNLLLENNILDTSKIHLEFFNPEDNDTIFDYRDNDPLFMAVSARHLYASTWHNQNIIPKKFSDLISLAFAGWVERPHVASIFKNNGYTLEDLAQLGTALYSYPINESHSFSFSSRPISVHHLKLGNLNLADQFALLAVETPQQTFDLTPALTENLKLFVKKLVVQNVELCTAEETQSLRLREFKAKRQPNDFEVSGSLTATCGSKTFRSLFVFSTEIFSQPELNTVHTDHLNMRFYSVSLIKTPSSMTCNSVLESDDKPSK